MKKVIAYSLWGDHPMYWKGALRNIELVERQLPDFICRFYIDDSCDQTLIDSIPENERVEKVMVKSKDSFHGMFWRFWAIDDPDVELVMIRDTDSRIGKREVAAIKEWLDSDKDFHIMRDHPYHTVPILGGMWGCRGELLKSLNITERITKWNQYGRKGIDQDFLGKDIYPIVKDNAIVHDEFFTFDKNRKPFPIARENYEFVGEIFDENDERHPDHWQIVKKIVK